MGLCPRLKPSVDKLSERGNWLVFDDPHFPLRQGSAIRRFHLARYTRVALSGASLNMLVILIPCPPELPPVELAEKLRLFAAE